MLRQAVLIWSSSHPPINNKVFYSNKTNRLSLTIIFSQHAKKSIQVYKGKFQAVKTAVNIWVNHMGRRPRSARLIWQLWHRPHNNFYDIFIGAWVLMPEVVWQRNAISFRNSKIQCKGGWCLCAILILPKSKHTHTQKTSPPAAETVSTKQVNLRAEQRESQCPFNSTKFNNDIKFICECHRGVRSQDERRT